MINLKELEVLKRFTNKYADERSLQHIKISDTYSVATDGHHGLVIKFGSLGITKDLLIDTAPRNPHARDEKEIKYPEVLDLLKYKKEEYVTLNTADLSRYIEGICATATIGIVKIGDNQMRHANNTITINELDFDQIFVSPEFLKNINIALKKLAKLQVDIYRGENMLVFKSGNLTAFVLEIEICEKEEGWQE